MKYTVRITSVWFPTAPKAFSNKTGKKSRCLLLLRYNSSSISLAHQETIQLSLCKWISFLFLLNFLWTFFFSSWINFLIFLLHAFLFFCPLCWFSLSHMVKQTAAALSACKFLFICKILGKTSWPHSLWGVLTKEGEYKSLLGCFQQQAPNSEPAMEGRGTEWTPGQVMAQALSWQERSRWVWSHFIGEISDLLTLTDIVPLYCPGSHD